MAKRKTGSDSTPAPVEAEPGVGPAQTGPTWPWRRLFDLVGALLVFLVVVQAWVAEDAFITFRVVDNFVHGFGLRWNVDERVQVFTHPLWLLLHLPLRALSGNLFLLTMIAGVVLTLGAVRLVLARSARAPQVATLFVVALVVSKSFVEFATSGLESSLAYLLVAALIVTALEAGTTGQPPPPFRTGLLIALVGLNRLDHLLLFLPLTILVWRGAPDRTYRRRLLAGFLPLVAWELFALYYYGFPLPNTAYAKLGGGLSRLLYLRQGILYLADFFRRDLVAATVLIGAILLPFLPGRAGADRPMAAAARRIHLALALGLALYVAYVIGVGGDFMTGRLWSVPFFAAAIVGLFSLPANLPEARAHLAVLLLVALRLVSVGLEPPLRVSGIHRERIWAGIKDERLSYSRGHTLYNFDRKNRFRWSIPSSGGYPPMAIHWWAVGLPPYLSGPHVVVVDGLALADPLLARLPALTGQNFLVGHIKRHVPLGYIEARASGSYRGLPDHLRDYYSRLQLITAAPLNAPGRLATILRFNLGHYEPLRKAYLATQPAADTMEAGVSVPAPRLARFQRGAPKAEP